MKRKIGTFLLIATTLLLVIITSCKDDDPDFTSISAFEQKLHDLVNAYRADNGVEPPLVLQYVMVKEAQLHSAEMATAEAGADLSEGLTERFLVVIDKIGGTNTNAILSVFGSVPADTIVNFWINDPDFSEILKGDWTQSGPGVAYDETGRIYVTHMFLNIPSK